MTAYMHPRFFELSRDDAVALLRRGHVGRLAFTFHDRVDIEPISYVYADGWIYARTAVGTKLTTVHHHPWVAFEVDEVQGRLDWLSVVVRGTIYFLDAGGGERDRDEYERAVEELRRVDPAAFSGADATPHRDAVFRIHVDEIVGRGATTTI